MRSNRKTAHEHVAGLRDALLSCSPEAIESCLPGLVEAVSAIRAMDPESLRAFQTELRTVKGLIEHGEKINQGLARLLGARIAGYIPSGDAAPVFATGTISVEG